jgi:dipeptidyl aminopeptidase/acylaminoacyl peptidase
VSFEESIQYFRVLQQNRIPSVLHIYPTGGHGWCEGPWFHYSREWKAELERWLIEE